MFDKVYGKKKAYSAAIDLTQDEDDYDTEEDEGPTPPLAKRRKTNEKQNNELQGIHQALKNSADDQVRWCTPEGTVHI